MSTTNGKPPPQMPTFEKTALPDFSLANPLGSGSKFISTAACLVIGDEVLNGKTKDSNSNYFAKFCFDLGIKLKQIKVVADNEETIIEAAHRLTTQHDLVVSSGGIGLTPDDITYQSMAKAFSEVGELVYDQVICRMEENSKVCQVNTKAITDEMLSARNRMALLPKQNAETIFPTTLWVPIIRMAGKLYILPGVPKLFKTLLENMRDYIPSIQTAPDLTEY
ncbi:hypothetical protein NDA13_005657 [Ustilago tritici]|nr:hypothetical protein NDA13_005657 [Ustilago tritici]